PFLAQFLKMPRTFQTWKAEKLKAPQSAQRLQGR
ncbi:hypothetical protein SEEPB585_23071, partial [Salmonella enterica subsp. enterica serovar Paratyphi B str. ATCC BAA-1585]